MTTAASAIGSRNRAPSRWRPSRRALIGVATLVALTILWVASTTLTGWISPGRFPSPPEVWEAARQIAIRGYAGGTLVFQCWYSLRLVLLGFVVAVATGVPLGLWMGWSRRAEALINPAFLLIRPIPPLAWIPLAIVWFGLGDVAKIFVIWFAAFVPSLINAYTGVRTVDPTLIAAARVMGASDRRLLLDVVLPSAMPMIFTGLRLSLQASWTTLVAAELVGAIFGLGRVLVIAYQDIYPAMIFVAMVCVGVLGALTTRGLAVIERRVLPWRA